ncbi:MAG: antibiotic ABC transporter ATP-binding protein [Candidatus Cloacimonadota bacterium]|nr:MAG: antibiotic ABC transporter ATP-binding protein [Candidatus Cloacimonadota bacterium]
MKNIVRIYKIMSAYWIYLVFGLLFMGLFALFSGVSVTMVTPIFDEIFIDKTNAEITTAKEFLCGEADLIKNFLHNNEINIFDASSFSPLTDKMRKLMYKTDSFLLLKLIATLTIILFLCKNTFFYLQKIMLINLRGKTVKDIRNKMFENYLKQSAAFFNHNKVGDSLVRMVNDVEIVSERFIISIFGIIRETVLIFVFLFIALSINSKLFLISITVVPFFTLAVAGLGSKMKKYSKRVQNQFSNMFSAIEEILGNMKIVIAYNKENHELEHVKEINKKHFKFWRKSMLYDALNIPLSEMNSAITGVVVLLIGGRLVLTNPEFTFGEFIAFMFAVFSMLHPVKVIAKSFSHIKKATASLDRISYVLDLKSQIKETDSPVAISELKEKIEFRNVSFSYDGKKKVLQNINLSIKKGETVALAGTSGSGKTTIANLLPRFYDTESGEILIDNIPIKNLKLKDLRKLFGTVTQESILFSDTVRNNVIYGTDKKISDEELIKACKIAHASEFIENFENKYDELLGTKGSNLSGGQKQRLGIARAVIGDPPILIFDEATSALDTESEKNVQSAINEATRNRTVIVIAHRLSTILSADKIVVMDKGKILGIGKHEELIKSCNKYKTLYSLQFSQTDKG